MKTITAPDRQYFYHPDLPIFIGMGSPAFITDADGEAHQHMQYLPFGETFIDQRIDWNPRFTFTDKEKDKATGYHFPIAIGIGARYYDSEVSVWLSVDPLAKKYPSISVYMYTGGNPIMLIDPDGNRIDISYLIDKHKKVLIRELKKLTGITTLKEEDGFLTYDKEGKIEGGSRLV